VGGGQVSDPAALSRLEYTIPGVLVYARQSGRRSRLDKILDRPGDRTFHRFEIVVPVHGAWLVESALMDAGLHYVAQDHGVNGLSFWDDSPQWREEMLQAGQRLVEASVTRGETRQHIMDIATPYQFTGAAWAAHRPWVLDVWACGGGKTLGAILAAFTRRGPILVICPAKARHVWWSQVQEYTHLLPYRMMPVSERRKGDVSLTEYLDQCADAHVRPFVIIGAEALANHLPAAKRINPGVLIFDELHIHGSKKRWRAIQQADGTVEFERRKTDASNRVGSSVDRENRAVAIMDASRLPGLQLRIGLTATPLDDGRPRRLWSQLDLLSPGGFAYSYSKFAHRYCAARPGKWGGLEDTGASNLGELRARCSFMMHEVPYSESHSALPSTRVQVVYLGNSELNRSERWSDDQTFGQALKDIGKEARDAHRDSPARERFVEARLAEACGRKRRYVVDEAVEGLRGGGKVVVFTARRRETEKWAEAIEKAIGKGDSAMCDVPIWMGHGGVSETDRSEMVDTFRTHPGPCCIVGTGQAFGTAVDGLQTSSLAIFAMLPWKPGDFVQWKGRFDRLGGSATLLKVVVAEGTYDERVVEILVHKFGPIEQMLAADELRGLDEKLHGLEDTEALVASIISKLEGD